MQIKQIVYVTFNLAYRDDRNIYHHHGVATIIIQQTQI